MFTRTYPGCTSVHQGSFGLLVCALGVVAYIRCHSVNLRAPSGSLRISGVIRLSCVRCRDHSESWGSLTYTLWVRSVHLGSLGSLARPRDRLVHPGPLGTITCALAVVGVAMFIRSRCVHSRAP